MEITKLALSKIFVVFGAAFLFRATPALFLCLCRRWANWCKSEYDTTSQKSGFSRHSFHSSRGEALRIWIRWKAIDSIVGACYALIAIKSVFDCEISATILMSLPRPQHSTLCKAICSISRSSMKEFFYLHIDRKYKDSGSNVHSNVPERVHMFRKGKGTWTSESHHVL